jgi:hypothetical protein
MPTRRNFFAVVAGLAPAITIKTAWTNPLSWFKPHARERSVELVINLPRSHWNLLADLFRKQLAGESSPTAERKLTEEILRKIERILADSEADDPLSLEATVLSASPL